MQDTAFPRWRLSPPGKSGQRNSACRRCGRGRGLGDVVDQPVEGRSGLGHFECFHGIILDVRNGVRHREDEVNGHLCFATGMGFAVSGVGEGLPVVIFALFYTAGAEPRDPGRDFRVIVGSSCGRLVGLFWPSSSFRVASSRPHRSGNLDRAVRIHRRRAREPAGNAP